MSNVSGDKHLIQNLLQKHKLKCLFIKSNSQKLYKLFLFTLLHTFLSTSKRKEIYENVKDEVSKLFPRIIKIIIRGAIKEKS